MQKRNGEGVSSTPLVILHVTAPARVGGLERVVAALTIGQQRMGHSVHVAASVDPGAGATHPLVVELRAAGVAVEPVEVGGRAYLRERAAIAALCRRISPDVVHTHGSRPDIGDAGVARGLGVPTVSTVHGFTGGGWKNRCYEWLQERAFRKFDAVVAVSQPIVDRLLARGVPADRLHLLRNVWSGGSPMLSREEARRALGIPLPEFRVGWVGRLTKEKGPDVMVAAVGAGLDPEWHLSMIGGGRERDGLELMAKSLQVDGLISWHGGVPDAARTMKAFDVFVLSSRTEGTPIVLFEAMAAGIPVVATRVGGVPDVLSEREAFLVPSEDPRAIVSAIRRIVTDPSEGARRVAAAQERLAREFAVGPWLDRYIEIYRTVVKERGRR